MSILWFGTTSDTLFVQWIDKQTLPKSLHPKLINSGSDYSEWSPLDATTKARLSPFLWQPSASPGSFTFGPDNIWQPCTSRRFCLNLLSPLGADTARQVAPNPFSREAPRILRISSSAPTCCSRTLALDAASLVACFWSYTATVGRQHQQLWYYETAADLLRPHWAVSYLGCIPELAENFKQECVLLQASVSSSIDIHHWLLPLYLPHILMDDTESEAILIQFYTIPHLYPSKNIDLWGELTKMHKKKYLYKMYLFIFIKSNFILEIDDYWIDWQIYILCDTKYAKKGNVLQ